MHTSELKGSECEFCTELQNPSQSVFAKRYGKESRALFREGGFVAMPTIGQLFQGHSLLVPEQHVERFADLSDQELETVDAIVVRLQKLVAPSGSYIVFEHGAKCSTGGSCGIYHAHLHVVPTQQKVTADQLLAEGENFESSISAELKRLRESDQYLVCFDSQGNGRSKIISLEEQSQYPSQFFRRKLAQIFDIAHSWDWRTYSEIESGVVQTLNLGTKP